LTEVLYKYGAGVQQLENFRVVYHDLEQEISPSVANQIGKPDIIIHLAATSDVGESLTNPLKTIRNNVLGTANLLEYARTIGNLERFVYFSTNEIFGIAPDGVFYKERDRYNPTTPYSGSKAAGEELCTAYYNSFGLPVYVIRIMNVFGERQPYDKFIPMCIRKVRDSEKIIIHGDVSTNKPSSRFYIHALDVADATMFLLKDVDPKKFESDFGGATCPKFNVVGEEVDNLTVAKSIAKIMDRPLDYEMVDYSKARPGHNFRFSMSDKYMRKLGWKPKFSFKDRLRDTVNWTIYNRRWLEP
jgi:dTDP-glucose 4,6-dehydratase